MSEQNGLPSRFLCPNIFVYILNAKQYKATTNSISWGRQVLQ